MATLGVNVDHIANIRQARRAAEPDPVTAALLAELAGAEGITVHLRSDRRHIQEEDVRLLRRLVKTRLNLERAATPEMLRIACEIKPDCVTLVPERPEELTTEGGLDVAGKQKSLKKAISRLTLAGIETSVFINPDERQVKAARACGAQLIEIHTGIYAAANAQRQEEELEKVVQAVCQALDLNLGVNAGHDLNYRNVIPIAAIPCINELNIGHSIVARAAFVGIEQAVYQMLALIKEGEALSCD